MSKTGWHCTIAVVVAVSIGLLVYILLLAPDGKPLLQPNKLCAGHGGVRQVQADGQAYPLFVICNDGLYTHE